MFLAQVDEKGGDDEKGESSKKAKEEQKKGFLEKMRAKKEAKAGEGGSTQEKLFEKQVKLKWH